MANPTLIKNFVAGTDISQSRIVKFGTDDTTVALAVAGTDAVFGITEQLPALAGQRVDVIVSGIAECEFGATIARGTKVTADTAGRAKASVAGDRIIGIALASAAAGEFAPVLISQS